MIEHASCCRSRLFSKRDLRQRPHLETALLALISAIVVSPSAVATEPAGIVVVPIDTGVELVPDTAMPGVEGQPVVRGRAQPLFSAGDGQFTVGVWAGTAGTVKLDAYPVDEVWRVVEGSITFTNDQGVSQSFSPGDSFVLPRGFTGTAVVGEGFRKVYVAFAPAGRPK